MPWKINDDPEQVFSGQEIEPSDQQLKDITAKESRQLKSTKNEKVMDKDDILIKDTIPKNMEKIKRIEFLKDEKAWIFFENGLEITNWQKAVDKNYISKEKADQLITDIKTTKHPLIIVNGKEEPSFTESSLYIYQNNAAKINKLSSSEAINKYGSKGANGVIEITNEEKLTALLLQKSKSHLNFPEMRWPLENFWKKM